jgi:hypothetical protein
MNLLRVGHGEKQIDAQAGNGWETDGHEVKAMIKQQRWRCMGIVEIESYRVSIASLARQHKYWLASLVVRGWKRRSHLPSHLA